MSLHKPKKNKGTGSGVVPQPGDANFVGPQAPAPTVRDKLRRRLRASQKANGAAPQPKNKKPTLRELLKKAAKR